MRVWLRLPKLGLYQKTGLKPQVKFVGCLRSRLVKERPVEVAI